MDNPQLQVGKTSWAKYPLLFFVLLYLFWLLGLPMITLVQESMARGWDAMRLDFENSQVFRALGLTLFLSGGAVFFNSIFGTALAWLMVRHQIRGRRLINAFLDLPFAISPVVVGYMFILLFGRQGWLEPLAQWTGIRWVFSIPGMLLANLFVTFPFVVRELIPVLQEIGTDQEEASYTLGAGSWKTFWRITFPNIKWGLLYGVSLTFARSLGEFGAILVVGAGIPGWTETATVFVYRALEERMYAGAYGVSLFLILFSFLLLLGMELLRKKRKV